MSKKAEKKERSSSSINDIANIVNSVAGGKRAFSWDDEDHPSRVKQWIPTGSRVLDSTICKGKRAGIPVGKITGLAGLPSTGKSYMAAQIAANAQKMGITVVYYDAESSIDPAFLEEVGITQENFLYIQPECVEDVLDSIDALLDKVSNPMLFIWDSLAATPERKALDQSAGDVNGSIAMKPRIIGNALRKLMTKLGGHQSTLIIINQLITNIPTNQFDFEAKMEPYVTPGGNALKFAYSLEIWLTRRKAKSAFVTGRHGEISGAEVVATMRKSRFGTEKRQCTFNIEWGENLGIQDEQSWFEAIAHSDRLKTGAWNKLTLNNGEEKSFRATDWSDLVTNDKEFRETVLEILDYELIHKYVEQGGEHFVDVEKGLEKLTNNSDSNDE